MNRPKITIECSIDDSMKDGLVRWNIGSDLPNWKYIFMNDLRDLFLRFAKVKESELTFHILCSTDTKFIIKEKAMIYSINEDQRIELNSFT